MSLNAKMDEAFGAAQNDSEGAGRGYAKLLGAYEAIVLSLVRCSANQDYDESYVIQSLSNTIRRLQGVED